MLDRVQYRQAIRQTMWDLTAQSTPHADADVKDRLRAVTEAAVALIRGAEYADVMLIESEQFESIAATAPLISDLDAVQVRFHQGPCLEAAVADAVIRVPDLRSEKRWPEFTAAALAAGVYSAMSFQLYTHQHGTGALNVFSGAVGAFNADDEAVGAMLATHAASLLIADRQTVDMESKLAGRDLIGQAKGILMERFVIDAGSAFELMIACSHNTKTSIHGVAHDIVATI